MPERPKPLRRQARPRRWSRPGRSLCLTAWPDQPAHGAVGPGAATAAARGLPVGRASRSSAAVHRQLDQQGVVRSRAAAGLAQALRSCSAPCPHLLPHSGASGITSRPEIGQLPSSPDVLVTDPASLPLPELRAACNYFSLQATGMPPGARPSASIGISIIMQVSSKMQTGFGLSVLLPACAQSCLHRCLAHVPGVHTLQIACVWVLTATGQLTCHGQGCDGTLIRAF